MTQLRKLFFMLCGACAMSAPILFIAGYTWRAVAMWALGTVIWIIAHWSYWDD